MYKTKTIFPSFLLSILGVLLILATCSTFSEKPNTEVNNNKNGSQNSTQKSDKPVYTGNGGKGITIVVPTPQMQNPTINDNWMPQLFQDLITGDLSRYSAMTVLDRLNEKLVLAEQNLSLSGNYSDNDYIRIGNLTNAQFIVAGNIQNISGRYNVSFRINNTETNEIKASFNKSYPITDIESGLAAKEAVRELLAGMGIELTEAGERSLLTIQPVEVRATTQLARGNQAIKTGNEVEAVAFFTEALSSNNTRAEADRNIESVFNTSIGTSIKERANYAQTQIDKWNKIFKDLRTYLDDNLVLIVYDFDTIEDAINMSNKTVTFTLKSGIKILPNRTALLVWKKIIDEWNQTKALESNKIWVSNVRLDSFGGRSGNTRTGGIGYGCYFEIGLYDIYGDCIKSITYNTGSSNIIEYREPERFQPKAQFKYFEEKQFVAIQFVSIPIDKVTDTITPKLENWYFSSMDKSKKPAYSPMTVAEWQTWLNQQGNAK